MWPHFHALFYRIIHGMPALVSSNWIAWGLGAFVFVAYLLSILWARGWTEMKRQWRENINRGVVTGFLGYCVLFGLSTIVTVYDDHHDVTGRWRAVVNEKDKLFGQLKDRDKYIAQLEAETKQGPRIVEKAIPERKQCWLDSIPREPNRFVKDAVTATMAIIRCNYRIDAPFNVAVKFDKEFLNGGVFLPASGAVMLNGNPVKQPGNVLVAQINSPNLAANQLVVVEIQTASKQFANAIGGEIKSK